MSNHTKENRGADSSELLEDENRPSCRGFMPSTQTFHGGGRDAGAVDGVFQVIGRDVDPALEDASETGTREEEVQDSEDGDDDEAEMSYNSQGKPLPRGSAVMKATSGERKQARKAIAKPARPKK